MKAARFHSAGEDLKIEDVHTPQVGIGEVLVKVMACGVCGSDVHIAIEGTTLTKFRPIILGHEPSGVVTEIGPGVDKFSPGDRVAICSIVACGQCMNCRTGNQQICLKRELIGIHKNGALAEYVSVPAENLVILPSNVPFEIGAIITDAVATPYHAIFKRGRLNAGESVAVFGCGGLGVHGVQLARMGGASLIIAVDVRAFALDHALKVGADLTVNANDEDPVKRIRDATGGIGVDLAVEFVGKISIIAQTVKSLRSGGRACIAGLGPEPVTTLSPNEFVRSEVSLLGSYGFTVSEIADLIGLTDSGRLDLSRSVSLVMPLEQTNQSLHRIKDRQEDFIRIVIKPNA